MGWKTITGKINPELSTNINLAIEKGSLKIVIKNRFVFYSRDSQGGFQVTGSYRAGGRS